MLEIRHCSIALNQRSLFTDINLVIPPGDIVTVMGASGSGKSTLLNWILGDLADDFQVTGELWLNGQRRDKLPVEQRHISILFQDDLLFPHMNVGQNLAFALTSKITGRKARQQTISDVLERVGLAGFETRDVSTLSGGQKARVSLLRALLTEPEALLLDEPFAQLDSQSRAQFREFVFAEIARQQLPTLLVTHDRTDVREGGRIIEIGLSHLERL